MSDRSVSHASFALERTYDASPARVFAAFAQPKAKAQWFVGPDDWASCEHQLDFRVGGRETVSGGPEGGPVFTYRAAYHDIVPDERIVVAYDMYLNQTRMSVSLAAFELIRDGAGTRLIYTEQGAFFDGFNDPGAHERGTADLLDGLGRYLAREPANA